MDVRGPVVGDNEACTRRGVDGVCVGNSKGDQCMSKVVAGAESVETRSVCDRELVGRVIAVTGATGFLGGWILPELLVRGCTVRVVGRSVSQNQLEVKQWALRSKLSEEEVLARVSTWTAELDDTAALSNAFSGCYAVLHLAAVVSHSVYDIEQLERVNVNGSRCVADAAVRKGVSRLVVASTSGVVAVERRSDKEPTIHRNDAKIAPMASELPYYASKVRAEKTILEVVRAHGTGAPRVTFIRPPMMLVRSIWYLTVKALTVSLKGPGDSRLRSVKSVLKFLRRQHPYVPRGGLSFCDVRDAAVAFVNAVSADSLDSTAYLLGGCNCTVEQYFNLLSMLSGVRPPALRFVPTQLSVPLVKAMKAVAVRIGVTDSLNPETLVPPVLLIVLVWMLLIDVLR